MRPLYGIVFPIALSVGILVLLSRAFSDLASDALPIEALWRLLALLLVKYTSFILIFSLFLRRAFGDGAFFSTTRNGFLVCRRYRPASFYRAFFNFCPAGDGGLFCFLFFCFSVGGTRQRGYAHHAGAKIQSGIGFLPESFAGFRALNMFIFPAKAPRSGFLSPLPAAIHTK